MSALKPDGRQYVLSAESLIAFGDIPGSAEVEVLELPQGSVITAMKLFVDTAFAGGTTHDLNIGDTVDPNRYSQTVVEIDAAGIPANPPDLDFAAGRATTGAEVNVVVTPVHTGGDPTSGSARLYVEYYVQGRHNENQG